MKLPQNVVHKIENMRNREHDSRRLQKFTEKILRKIEKENTEKRFICERARAYACVRVVNMENWRK